MKSEREQHGKEANTEVLRKGTAYEDWQELAPQRKTFGDVNKSGRKNAGHDKSWSDATKKTSRQGDGNPGPITRISGGKNGDVVDQKDRSQYKYVAGGKKYSAEFGRVPDAGKKWEATPFVDSQGDPALYVNRLPQLPANLRPVQIGWRGRYKDSLDAQIGGAATSASTPQRRKQRKSESK